MFPTKLLNQLKSENFWSLPCVHTGSISNDTEAEHAFVFGGKSIQERWNIVPVRRKFNRNPSQDVKDWSKLCALQQARENGLWGHLCKKYKRFDWDKEWERLQLKFMP